jgi:hypothetical protein
MDYIGGGSINSTPATGFNAYTFGHFPSKGWDVMFNDGSVKFCKSILAYNLAVALPDPDGATPTQYEPLLQALEDAP